MNIRIAMGALCALGFVASSYSFAAAQAGRVTTPTPSIPRPGLHMNYTKITIPYEEGRSKQGEVKKTRAEPRPKMRPTGNNRKFELKPVLVTGQHKGARTKQKSEGAEKRW
jgi:hypothetical protein